MPDKPPRIAARGRPGDSDPPPLPHPDTLFKSKSPASFSQVHFSNTNSSNHYLSSSPTKFLASSPVHFEMNNYDNYDGYPSSNYSNGHQNSSTSPRSYSSSSNGYLPSAQQKYRHSPTKNVVQDLLMYKKFQNGLKPANGRIPFEESIDTTHLDDDESTTSGSYYIENTADDFHHSPVSNVYV